MTAGRKLDTPKENLDAISDSTARDHDGNSFILCDGAFGPDRQERLPRGEEDRYSSLPLIDGRTPSCGGAARVM